MPLASARQHLENQKENQAGHSSERAVEGQGRPTPRRSRTPRGWNVNFVHYVHKGGSDGNLSNHRPLALIEVLRKVFTGIVVITLGYVCVGRMHRHANTTRRCTKK